MGRTKRKGGKHDEKAQKRKRRRKARTDVSSDSDSSSGDEVQVSEAKSNVVIENAPVIAPAVFNDGNGEDSEHEEANGQETTKKFTEKGGRIPSPLRDLHDPQADAKFEEYYMQLITEEFGDDLDTVRGAKDFGDKSLPMLVRALQQGVNIFDPAEKRAVIKEMA